jgi:hypothetical protein
MALILAIEPDKRQSSQLANLVKGQLGAELLHGTSVAEGLAALHGRVPDLVLTSSLISPRDDAALATHLRELGAAAAHVQSVTIPLLGSAAPARVKSGLLAALRREKPQPMTDGCAPEAFAEQIRQYLATAEEQKIAAATRLAAEPVAVAEPLDVPEPIAEPEPIEVEFAPLETETFVAPEPQPEPEPALFVEALAEEPPVDEVEAAPVDEAEELMADEPAGLPLSQLLQLVTETAVVEAPILEEPIFHEAIFHEPIIEAMPIAEVAPVAEVASVDDIVPVAEPEPAAEPELVVESEIVAQPEPAGEPAADSGELRVDPIAAQALDELSRQAPPSSLADGLPAEAPVPVVEMHSFQSLDSIASELAAGPSQPRYESLDDLASLFAATPATPAARATAPARLEPSHDFTAPPGDDTSPFASLFAKPAQATPPPVAAIQPDVDPSLFASAPASAPTIDAVPEPAMAALAFEIETFEPAPAPVLDAEVAPVLALAHEREPEPEPIFVQPVPEIVPEPELVIASPEPVVEQIATPAFDVEPEPEPQAQEDEPVIGFEPVVFEPFYEEPAAIAASPLLDEEISLDVDAFVAPPVEAPAAVVAEPAPFAFTLVDGFGDAWSDFEVPSVAAVAADLGIGEYAPSEPYSTAAAPVATSAPTESPDEDEAPALDDEALSIIGDAARKASLDAMVIQEFERGLEAHRPKKANKKKHAGATQVQPAAERPAKPTKRPVQDEWGMFDPEQCGFAALEDEEGAEARPTTGTRVRVISY